MSEKQPLDFSNYSKIPSHTQDALQRYWQHDIPPGGFLTAVLQNDLFGAISRADPFNRAALDDIVRFVYNELPISIPVDVDESE